MNTEASRYRIKASYYKPSYKLKEEGNLLVKIKGNELKLTIGDITEQNVDVIINAANGTLLGGGGVDGAIHKKAGPELLHACKTIRENELNGEYLQTGNAVITDGFNLLAKHVIHTVGPIWNGGKDNEANLLKKCYVNSLALTEQYHLNTIAFPAISTGVYRYPIKEAAYIALQTIVNYLRQTTNKTIVMTLFSEADYEIYKKQLHIILDHYKKSG